MTRILFICHGNICRSAGAEIVLRHMLRENRLDRTVLVSSAATTREEIGHDIYPPMKKVLLDREYDCGRHAARQTTREDYRRYDFIIGMDEENLLDLRRIYGGDPEKKLSMLMDWAGMPNREIDDPWYTRDFQGALDQIEKGCNGLIAALKKQK